MMNFIIRCCCAGAAAAAVRVIPYPANRFRIRLLHRRTAKHDADLSISQTD